MHKRNRHLVDNSSRCICFLTEKTGGTFYTVNYASEHGQANPTLFMLMSVDGKISTGSTDELDVDRDFPKIPGVREGLHQYYEIEQTTGLWSFDRGRVQAKMGVNEKELPDKTPVSFVLLDNHHLTEHGVRYFCALSRQAVVITSNASHPIMVPAIQTTSSKTIVNMV